MPVTRGFAFVRGRRRLAAPSVALVLAVFAACSDGPATPAEDEDDARIILPGDPPADAPRNEIVFLSGRGGGAGAPLQGLWAVRADGTGERKVVGTDVVASVLGFDVSRDGTRLTFAARAEAGRPGTDIMRVDVTGGAPVNVTRVNERFPGEESVPFFTKARWSADGSTFTAALQWEGKWDIRLVDGAGEFVRTLAGNTGTFRDWQPRWSPDGSYLALLSDRRLPELGSNWQLYVEHVVTGSVHHVSTNVAWAAPGVWSPDGRTLAYSGGRGLDNHSVYLAAPDVANIRRIAEGETQRIRHAHSPTWAADGRSLAFVGAMATGPEIFVVNADGTGLRRATYLRGSSADPAFSPDGGHIAFDSTRDGVTDVYVVRLRDLRVWRVSDGHRDAFPAWLPLR